MNPTQNLNQGQIEALARGDFNNMKVFYFIICLVLLYQCRNAQHSQDQTSIHITIKGDFQGVSADSLFSSVTYIPLETSKNSLLVSINKIHIQDSTIYTR